MKLFPNFTRHHLITHTNDNEIVLLLLLLLLLLLNNTDLILGLLRTFKIIIIAALVLAVSSFLGKFDLEAFFTFFD